MEAVKKGNSNPKNADINTCLPINFQLDLEKGCSFISLSLATVFFECKANLVDLFPSRIGPIALFRPTCGVLRIGE